MTARDLSVRQEYRTVAVDSIEPHPSNPRRGDVEAIRESIAENGFYGTILVQESTGRIIAGEHRWRAAKESGATVVPVLYADLSDEQALRILAVDNRVNELATFDDGELASLLQEIAGESGDLSGSGYTDDDLADLLIAIEGDESSDDVAPEETKQKFQEYADRIREGRRLMVLDLPMTRFAWLADALGLYCEQQGIEPVDHAEAVIRITADALGQEVPTDE